MGHRRSKLKVAKAQSRSAAGAGGAGGAGDDDNDDDEEDGYEDDDDHYNAGESEEPLDEGRTVYVQGPTAASLLAATAQQQPAATAGQQQIRVITAGMLAGGQLQQAAQVAQHQAVSVMSPTMAQQVLRASGGGAGQALRAIETGSGGVIVLPSQAVLPSAAPSRQLIIGPGGAIIQQAAPQTIALSLAPAPGGGLRLTPTAAAASRSTVITAASATGALGGATILPGGLQLQLQQAQQPLQQQVVDINSLAAQLRSQGVVLASGSSTGQQQQGGTGLQLCQVGGSLYALPVSNNAGLSHALVAQVHAQAQAQAQAHVQSRQQQQEELLSLLLAQQAARSNKNG